jgi:hypothetical protein
MEISFTWDLTLNRKFIYVTYIIYEYSFNVISNTVLINCVHETNFRGIEFSSCDTAIQKALDLEHLRFWIF